eukprot:gnl/MRDRNA2_/MRDRNA2_70118_c0_seq3.p1 gnl/MRDRNA2_/MRDRNA2_70118_c0~~gnl/MRDRNA2_/MRDRNA2_70118_c0_seq3.p1  ORF type:complete len:193 (-),score=16.89 gnl/MRDRNA2_/MRDRNA2_70118_c0_seq3:200-778(-)
MVVPGVVVVIGTVGGLLIAGPRILASITSRTLQLVLADRALHREAQRLADERIGELVWSQSMKTGLCDALITLLTRKDFAAASVTLVDSISQDQALKRTITLGVMEALQNQTMQAELKSLLIQGMQDKELHWTGKHIAMHSFPAHGTPVGFHRAALLVPDISCGGFHRSCVNFCAIFCLQSELLPDIYCNHF